MSGSIFKIGEKFSEQGGKVIKIFLVFKKLYTHHLGNQDSP